MPSTLKHHFTSPPEPGFTLEDKGFKFVVVKAKAHRNLQGDASAVITWRGWCAEDGEPFEFKTGAKVYHLSKRCKEHNRGSVAASPYVAPVPAEVEDKVMAELLALTRRFPARAAEIRAVAMLYVKRDAAQDDEAQAAADLMD